MASSPKKCDWCGKKRMTALMFEHIVDNSRFMMCSRKCINKMDKYLAAIRKEAVDFQVG